MAATLALGLTVLLPGAAVALLIAGGRRDGERRRIGAAALLFDAVVLGLATHLLAGLVAMRLGVFSAGTILITAASTSVVAGAAAARWRHRLPRVTTTRSPWLAAGSLALLGTALWLRDDPAYFLPMTGDMGEYVNLAQVIARGESIVESFPHLFPVFLALPTALFGRADTVSAVPLAGLVVLGATLRLGGLLRVPTVPRLAVTAAVTVGVVPVWYSLFPASEALYAALVMTALVFLVRAHLEERAHLALLSGSTALLLALLRGNALLLAPVAVAYLLVAALGRSRPRLRIDLAFTLGLFAGLAGGYAYAVEYLPTYYVSRQIGTEFLPQRAFTALDELGLFEVGPPLVVTVVIGMAAVAGAASGLHRVASRARDVPRTWVPAAVLAGGTVAVLALGAGSVTSGLARSGLALPAAGLAGLGAAAWFAREQREIVLRLALLGSLLSAVYGALQAFRFPAERGAPYFLYWERYLFSEVYPALVAGALLGLGLAWRRLRPRVGTRTAAAAGVGLLAVPALLLPTTLRATSEQLLDGAYELTRDVDAATNPDDVPLVYSGYEVPRTRWFYENSFRVFGLPLRLAFDREVLNLPVQPYTADPSPRLDEIEALMAERGLDRVYLVRFTRPGGEAPPDPAGTDLTVEPVARFERSIPVIPRRRGGGEQYRHYPARLEVYEISRG